jgi:hypothetical protein
MKVSLEETAIVIHQILQVFAIENIHKMPGTLACIQVDINIQFYAEISIFRLGIRSSEFAETYQSSRISA